QAEDGIRDWSVTGVQTCALPILGDGRADDSAAIQQALDAAAATPGGGIVFLPQGTYRISRTLFLWPGVRIFGIGAQRPVILLGRSEERRVGKECRSRWSRDDQE